MLAEWEILLRTDARPLVPALTGWIKPIVLLLNVTLKWSYLTKYTNIHEKGVVLDVDLSKPSYIKRYREMCF